MKKIVIALCFLCYINLSKSQDTLVTFTRILTLDSISKYEIFDNTLVWCSKSFTDSKNAINVKERDGGIIAGKAYFLSPYKFPTKKDSILGEYFTTYYFDWLIEIKNGKLRFSIPNLFYNWQDINYPVSSSKKPPIWVMFQPKIRTEQHWIISKQYLISNLDKLVESLKFHLIKPKSSW